MLNLLCLITLSSRSKLTMYNYNFASMRGFLCAKHCNTKCLQKGGHGEDGMIELFYSLSCRLREKSICRGTCRMIMWWAFTVTLRTKTMCTLCWRIAVERYRMQHHHVSPCHQQNPAFILSLAVSLFSASAILNKNVCVLRAHTQTTSSSSHKNTL